MRDDMSPIPNEDEVVIQESKLTGRSSPMTLKSQFKDDPRVLKVLTSKHPCEVSGPVLLPKDRQSLWKNLCMIGSNHIECIVEFSRN